MPTTTKVLRTLGAALGLAVLLAAPAQAASGPTNPENCTPAGKFGQPFLPWGDSGLYTPITNAGLEHETEGWSFSGDAVITDGNEPWFISGNRRDNHSLDLPEGSSATTGTICIDETYTHFRLFARNAGALRSELRIEVLYYDRRGRLVATDPFSYRSASGDWALTGSVPITIFNDQPGVAPIAFRFTPKGADAHFQIDDVYVDPWSRT